MGASVGAAEVLSDAGSEGHVATSRALGGWVAGKHLAGLIAVGSVEGRLILTGPGHMGLWCDDRVRW